MKYIKEVALIFELIEKDEKLLNYYQDFDLLIELLQELWIYEKEFEALYILSHYILISKKYE